MGLISLTLPVDGTTADVADYNVPLTTIATLVNGNIDNSNIAVGAAIDGAKLASGTVTSTQINFGGSGAGVWWQEIGRTTLSVAGDTISVTPIASRKYLRVIVISIGTGNVTPVLRFNNDSGSNYSYRYSANNAADTTATSTTSIFAGGDANANSFMVFNIFDASAQAKAVYGLLSITFNSAATAPAHVEVAGNWQNTSGVISRVDVINTNTGDFSIGSEVVVLGHD